ncbi:MAG: EutN/CcmL family microcompartment protein [Acidimicrobiia bacterium]|nr:EutN/CcmL family microcompartment protein [Acidimicrobiia bacterium]
MKLALVTGTVVSTISAPVFDHQRLLFCDYLDPQGEPSGDYVIAVDVVDAGPGETVLIMDEGTGARQILEETVAPVRAIVVGIVDAY